MDFPDDLQHLIRTDEILAPRLWLGIGGPAQYFAEPTDASEITRLVTAAAKSGLPVRILGGGSNLLVRETGVEGLVISLESASTSEISVKDNFMTVGAGAKLSQAVIHAVGAGLGGLEHLVGIPGTVGGAVVGNISAGGRDIGASVAEVAVLQRDGSQKVVKHDEVRFSHRSSSLGDQPILSIKFALQPSDAGALTKRMQKIWISRNSTRPQQLQRIALPFIDPDGMSAAELLNQVGLAGIREGAVSLDSSQPQYLVAESDATSAQCLKLIARVREQVLLQTGIDLQLNLQIW
jgi:UDP-N-acetylmuramate dehydrogenase